MITWFLSMSMNDITGMSFSFFMFFLPKLYWLPKTGEDVVLPFFSLLLGVYITMELSLPSIFGRRGLKTYMGLYFH